MDESWLFNDWLSRVLDPAILVSIERVLGAASVERARPALQTLGRINTALRRRVTATGGAPVAVAAAGDGGLAKLGSLDDFLAMTDTRDGMAALEAAVGARRAKEAREAASTLADIEAAMQKKLQRPLKKVAAGFDLFDQFIKQVGDPKSLQAMESAIGAHATQRARAAARELLEINGRLRAIEGD